MRFRNDCLLFFLTPSLFLLFLFGNHNKQVTSFGKRAEIESLPRSPLFLSWCYQKLRNSVVKTRERGKNKPCRPRPIPHPRILFPKEGLTPRRAPTARANSSVRFHLLTGRRSSKDTSRSSTANMRTGLINSVTPEFRTSMFRARTESSRKTHSYLL